eukprot:CAMPEP_0201577706 /NCGR_PEP_ID=MMETSP0190_2-20130828/24195_1 /ASSEMBLY_ACC=CAM_ASM_000263 /TAXON_ID=37353 /ORGANISM="Rosalina sp." /LENGTH=110 /DNA_ID=CAMNT_0048010019 /DNA_START=308 /DNA_END=640 /DNA_ORIENTATION=-
MANASASPLQSHQSKKLGKFFGDDSMSNTNSQSVINHNNGNDSSQSRSHIVNEQEISNSNISNVVEENENVTFTDTNDQTVEPEYSESLALRLQPHDIIVPTDNLSGSND